VQSSIMANKTVDTKAAKAILIGIKEEMAKPRVAKSARAAELKEAFTFPLSESRWPGLARPGRRIHKPVTHPGAS
jgi:hypothetical protein